MKRKIFKQTFINTIVLLLILIFVLGISTSIVLLLKNYNQKDLSSIKKENIENYDKIIYEKEVPLSNKITKDKTYSIVLKSFELINKEREKENLNPIEWNEELYETAKIRAKEASITWSHTRPNGEEWFTVNPDIMYGENLAKGYYNINSVVKAWMQSESHKENILYEDFKTGAIAIYIDENNKWYWASEFGY